MKDKILVGVIALVVSVASVWALTPMQKTATTSPIQQMFGNVPTLEGVDNPYVKIADKDMFYRAIPIIATSSVFCAQKNPYGATSSINRLSVRIDSNGMGAQNIFFATSTSASATSTTGVPTLVAGKSIASGAKLDFWWDAGQATTTANGALGPVSNPLGDSPFKLGPSEYLVFSTGTGTAGTFTSYFRGRCTVNVEKL